MTVTSGKLSRYVIAFVFSIGLIGAAAITASDRGKSSDNQYSRRIIKMKWTSDTVDQNIEGQMFFQPTTKSEMVMSVKSADITYRVETVVKSAMDVEPPHYFIEAKLIQQKGNSSPVVLSRPNLRTNEGLPVAVQLRTDSGDGITFEVLIEAAK